MYKKGFLLIFIYHLVGLTSCQRCEQTIPYYDFQSMSIYSINLDIPTTDSLIFRLAPDELNFVAKTSFNLSLFSTAKALKCIEDGHSGPKHLPSSIEITSDSDFDSTHLAGSILNDLFLTKELMVGSSFIPLNNFNPATLFNNGAYASSHQFYLATRPTIAKSHILTIKVLKSNGEQTQIKTESILWD